MRPRWAASRSASRPDRVPAAGPYVRSIGSGRGLSNAEIELFRMSGVLGRKSWSERADDAVRGARQEPADTRPPRETAAALGPDDAGRGDDPVLPEHGNGDCHGTGNDLADRSRDPGRDDVGQLGSQPFRVRDRWASRSVEGEDLLEDLVRGEGEEGLPEGA